MSTELRNVPGLNDTANKMMQTRFYGGNDRGACVQVTRQNNDRPFGYGYLQLSRSEAKLLALELMLFAEGQEVEAT